MQGKVNAAGIVFALLIIFFSTETFADSKKKDLPTEIDMVLVKGGCYKMGDTFNVSDRQGDEKPVHEACVDDFYIGKYEVTVTQFRAFVNNTGYKTEAEKGDGCYYINNGTVIKDKLHNWQNPGFQQRENNPVVCVSWNDSIEYINWLKQKSGLKYRLPTEAEWEYACRGGGKNEKYSGGNDIDKIAWFNKNSSMMSHQVGTKSPNGLGIYDMSGNAGEWTMDWYDLYYKNTPKDNPKGAKSGIGKVMRGGAWPHTPYYTRCAYRISRNPFIRAYDGSFRLLRTD